MTTYGPKRHSWKFEEMIRELQAQDKRSPVDVERRKVVAELTQVTEELTLLHDPENQKQMRLRNIYGRLTNKDPKFRCGLGPYADLEDIDEIRVRAVEDCRKGAEWAKELNITSELEIDRACDWATDAMRLVKRRRELEAQNDGLRSKTAERASGIGSVA